MKKVSLITTLCILLCQTALGQIHTDNKSAFQMSIFPPLSTNGFRSARFSNTVSVNLLVGVSLNEGALAIAGMSNIVLGNGYGVQVAGLFNYTGASVRGIQISGLTNYAANVRGVQVAGLVNVAKNVRGVQLSGLINIAKNSDIPIGLINIISNGQMGVGITYDGLSNAVIAFRSGGKYTYGILGVGYNHKVKSRDLVTQAGLGAHIPIAKWFRINNEVKVSNIKDDSNKLIYNTEYALMPAFVIGRHFELFGGLSINYLESHNVGAHHIFPRQSLWRGNSSAKLQQVYIGYQFGLQYIF